MKAHPLGGTIRASDLLARQERKFTMDMPGNLHSTLKQIAALSRTSAKDLVIEALTEYTIPKYMNKEVNHE